MIITDNLTQESLELLNKQLQNQYKCKTTHEKELQNAYYAGMKDMLSMILTNNYRNDGTIVYSNAIQSHIIVQIDQTENYSGDNEFNIHVVL